GDDEAAVGVSHEHDRARDRGQEAGQVGGVARRAPQRVGGGGAREALAREPRDHTAPRRAVGPVAVDEHDRGAGRGVVGGGGGGGGRGPPAPPPRGEARAARAGGARWW